MMGADLYIASIFEQQRNKYVGKFRHWARVRDHASTKLEQVHAQQQVNRYFDLMYEEGYFRDNYNPSNLLAKFELSWWEDVTPRLNADGQLEPTHLQWLLALMKRRESVFRSNIDQGPDREDYIRRYRQLRTFLRLALRCNEPIECSL